MDKRINLETVTLYDWRMAGLPQGGGEAAPRHNFTKMSAPSTRIPSIS